MTEKAAGKVRINVRDYGFHPLSLRIWHGMALDAWLRVMRGKWHLVSPRRYPLAVTITVFSISNMILKLITKLVYDRRLAKVEIDPDPIFVVGHARSGTTWLHNLLMKDPNHAAPTQGACLSPEFFLLTQGFVNAIIRRFTPEKRPMDNVEINPAQAEEDEIALCLSGAPSAYASMLFPNEEPILVFRPDQMSSEDGELWRSKWLRFLRSIQFLNPGKTLLLKSPTHSLRIPEILKLFPRARFIHIRRDPYRVFLSNQHTHKAMTSVMALQDHMPTEDEELEAQLARFVRFHEVMEADLKMIPEGQIARIRYEDLRADTRKSLETVYDVLSLGGFDKLKPALEKLEQAAKPYKTNSFELDDSVKARLDDAFAKFFDLHGYLPMDQRKTASK